MTILKRIKSTSGTVLFNFDHGLGDIILYLPIHEELQRQAGRKIMLTSPVRRGYHKISPLVKPLEEVDVKRFDLNYKVYYPDSRAYKPPFEYHDDPAKPFLCAYSEMGLAPFDYKPLQIPNKNDIKSMRVGVHFFGHTGCGEKFCPKETAEIIWNEIKELGYEPFECHMRPQFRGEYGDCGDDGCTFVDPSCSLRFIPPDLAIMRQEIGKCRFFVSVDSGPLYFASALLGFNRLIGLENLKRISYYCPRPFQKVSVRDYRQGTITNILKRKEEAYEKAIYHHDPNDFSDWRL